MIVLEMITVKTSGIELRERKKKNEAKGNRERKEKRELSGLIEKKRC